MGEPSPDTPGLIARPPIVYLCSILVGLALQSLWPWAVFPESLELAAGASLVLAAAVLFALSVREFRAAQTPIRSVQPTTTLVRSGPYRLSRNPIYLAFTLFQLGLGIWVNSAWLTGMLIPTLALMSCGVIAREERYLTRRFGDAYLDYKASVGRWM